MIIDDSGQNHVKNIPFCVCVWGFHDFLLFYTAKKCFMERKKKGSFISLIWNHWGYFIFKIRSSKANFMKAKLGKKNQLHGLALSACQLLKYLIAPLQCNFGMHIFAEKLTENIKRKTWNVKSKPRQVFIMKDKAAHWYLIITGHQKNHKCGKNKLNIDLSFFHSQQHQDA